MLLHQYLRGRIWGLLLAFYYLHFWMQLILYSLSRSRQNNCNNLMAPSIRGLSSLGGLEARLKECVGLLCVKMRQYENFFFARFES